MTTESETVGMGANIRLCRVFALQPDLNGPLAPDHLAHQTHQHRHPETKKLALADIKGFRIDQNYTQVLPKHPDQSTIKFSYATASYSELQQWLADQFPDLDAQKLQGSETALLADEALGQNEAERPDRCC
ncbi:hypothetical protein GCM10027048_14270 [Hymenobacter coalescens]